MPGKRKGPAMQGPASGSTPRLRSNYMNLVRSMKANGIGDKEAREFARTLQVLNDKRASGSISRRQYNKHFYEDFYDPLYEDYEYDLDEDYSEEE